MKNFAIDFNLNKDWIGGSYYVRNLIAAIGLLPPEEQPIITLLSDQAESVTFAQETGYPHLRWIKSGDFYKNPEDYPFDLIFPWSAEDQAYRTISWIPDFQELHLPYYFTPQEIANRRHHHRLRFAGAGLVVSSHDVAADVPRFYPGECQKVAVVHFASFDRVGGTPIDALKAKYGLTGRYVMCANQVWIHKNHIVILKALHILKTQGIDVTICFTGNESDYRVKGYTNFLKSMVREWGIAENVKFLGFIPRDDQLSLMNGASYIIQPSLFEGWSTVIEDAKSMHQFIVASDLNVHKEQLSTNCRFFPRHDPTALAETIREFAITPPERDHSYDYADNQREFAQDFMLAAEQFTGSIPTRPRKYSTEDLARFSAENMRT